MDKLIIIVLALALIFVFALVGAIFTQWAWAGSVAQIFHLQELTFSQAFWLNVLGGMLCKGTRGSGKS